MKVALLAAVLAFVPVAHAAHSGSGGGSQQQIQNLLSQEEQERQNSNNLANQLNTLLNNNRNVMGVPGGGVGNVSAPVSGDGPPPQDPPPAPAAPPAPPAQPAPPPTGPRTISQHTGVLVITKADGTVVTVQPNENAPLLNPGDTVAVQSGQCIMVVRDAGGHIVSQVAAGAGGSFVIAPRGDSIEVTGGSVLVGTQEGKILTLSKGDSVMVTPPASGPSQSVGSVGSASNPSSPSASGGNPQQETAVTNGDNNVSEPVSPSAP